MRRIACPPPNRLWSCASDRAQAERLDLGGAIPEALLEQDAVTLRAEARAVECRLGVEPLVDERRDELDVRLCLDEPAHDAERTEQLAVAEEHSRDDRVVRPAARLDLPRDGEARSAVLQDDSGSGRDDAAPEAAVQALDEGDRHPACVDGAEVDSPALQLPERRTARFPPPCEKGRVEQVLDVGAVAHALECVLEGQAHALDLRRERRFAERKEAQSLERCDSLSGRRQLTDRHAVVVECERLDPAGLERGEIGLVEPGAGCDRAGQLPAVQRSGPLAGEAPERSGEIRQPCARSPTPGSSRARPARPPRPPP